MPLGVATQGFHLLEVSTEILIAGGILTIAAGGLTIVGAQSGTTDDLDTVNIDAALAWNGYQLEVWLTATIGDTITIKHNTGNIVCNSGADVSLTENKAARLVRFIGTSNAVVNNKWKCIA